MTSSQRGGALQPPLIVHLYKPDMIACSRWQSRPCTRTPRLRSGRYPLSFQSMVCSVPWLVRRGRTTNTERGWRPPSMSSSVSCRMARTAAPIAAIYSGVRPLLFCVTNGAMTIRMNPKLHLIAQQWHVTAACCLVVNLMVPIGLLVRVNDEIRHCFLQGWLGRYFCRTSTLQNHINLNSRYINPAGNPLQVNAYLLSGVFLTSRPSWAAASCIASSSFASCWRSSLLTLR